MPASARTHVTSVALLIALALSLTLRALAGTSTGDGRDYYPNEARRHGLTGRVGLEYSCDDKGHAFNIAVIESSGSDFDAAAKQFLSDAHFKVASDRAASGGPAKRLRYGVIFELVGKPHVPHFDDDRHFVVITSRITP
jgi:TonB family protein